MNRKTLPPVNFPSVNFSSAFGLLGFLFFIVFTGFLTAFLIVLAPSLGLLLLGFLVTVVLGIALYKVLAPSAPFWVKMILMVVLGDFILSYGFTNLSIGAGSAKVTVAELVLLLTLFFLMFVSWKSFWISKVAALLLLLYVILPTLVHLPFDLPKHGASAARDYLPIVDALFFFAGLAVVYAAGNKATWLLWRDNFLKILLIISGLYLSLYAFQDTILQYSPRVVGYQQSVPLFGYFTTGNVLAMLGIFAIFLMPEKFSFGKQKPKPIILLIFLIAFLIAFVLLQSRTSYIAFVFFLIVLGFLGYGKAVASTFWAMLFLVLSLLVIDLFGLELEGRVGNIGLNMVTAQLESITGQGGLESAAGGVNERLGWWFDSINKWLFDTKSIFFGIGFGEALTNFYVMGAGGEAVIVREPHNSFISVLTRTGLIGFVVWLAFQAILIISVVNKLVLSKKAGNKQDAGYWTWVLFLFLAILFSAFVQPAFESPHFAVPYFFFAGIVLGQIALEKKKNNFENS